MKKQKLICLAFGLGLMVTPGDTMASTEDGRLKGYNVEKTGLVPKYPAAFNCSPLTSLYASWDDVDGSRRQEAHSGVDGGRFGEPVFAPAPGVVLAVWKANWGWGPEGALLIRHSREDLALPDGANYYYSEFDHLDYEKIKSIPEGKAVQRGERLASVSRPGGARRYLPEVHWEVWEIEDDGATAWRTNRFGGKYWTNAGGRLIDPLYMLARDTPPSPDGVVEIPVYDAAKSYRGFRGFTYILPCKPKPARKGKKPGR